MISTVANIEAKFHEDTFMIYKKEKSTLTLTKLLNVHVKIPI